MGTAQVARENLKKAHKSPLIGKHGKRETTIEKEILVENARAYYLAEVAKRLPQLTEAHLDASTDPKNGMERQYALNQLVGKPKETVEVQGEVRLKVDV